MTRELESLSIEAIRSLKGHCYKKLARAKDRIPEESGIYIWRYWPSLTKVEPEYFMEKVQEVQESFPAFHEILRNSRQEIHSYRTPFGAPEEGRFLGIAETSKKFERFKKLLVEENATQLEFAEVLDILFSFSPPLYIGKATNLKERITQHLELKTDFSKDLEDSNINKNDVFVSFVKDHISSNEQVVTDVIEEIVQRVSNPPFVKRYG